MAQYIFTMNRVSKQVPGGREILKNISLSFFPGAKIGVLGLNGAGKSSLLRIMAGEDKSFDGEARPQPGTKIGYLPQEPQLDPEKTVRQAVEEGMGEVKAISDRYNEINVRLCDLDLLPEDMQALLEEQAALQEQIEDHDAWDLDRKLDVAADALRLPDWDTLVGPLSGGEKRRVALCRLLMGDFDMLLLDEPTNHLDAESVAWLERFLEEFKGTVVAVTHDRYFLDNVAEWILELDRGQGYPHKGNYSSWLIEKEKRLGQEAREEERHQRALKSELEWVRSNPKGKRAKSKARMAQFETLCSKEFQKRSETESLYVPPGPRLGDVVIDANDLKKAYGDKLLMEDVNFQIPRGAIVGVIGANGAGKSTLFKLITKQETPDAGSIRVGDTVELAYVDQSRDSLDGSKTVWEEISDGLDEITVGSFTMNSRAYVSRFNFKGSDQQKAVGQLSGGERNRVHLAKLLRQGGNVLLLDEPTNDLDVETLRSLEEALLNFAGCIIVISHDRWFLDRIATHILAFEGDSHVEWFEGNYQEYDKDRHQHLGSEADQPHKIKYKRIS